MGSDWVKNTLSVSILLAVCPSGCDPRHCPALFRTWHLNSEGNAVVSQGLLLARLSCRKYGFLSRGFSAGRIRRGCTPRADCTSSTIFSVFGFCSLGTVGGAGAMYSGERIAPFPLQH
jgi:hypothetical protein